MLLLLRIVLQEVLQEAPTRLISATCTAYIEKWKCNDLTTPRLTPQGDLIGAETHSKSNKIMFLYN